MSAFMFWLCVQGEDIINVDICGHYNHQVHTIVSLVWTAMNSLNHMGYARLYLVLAIVSNWICDCSLEEKLKNNKKISWNNFRFCARIIKNIVK